VSKYVKMTPCHHDEGDFFAMGHTDAIDHVCKVKFLPRARLKLRGHQEYTEVMPKASNAKGQPFKVSTRTQCHQV